MRNTRRFYCTLIGVSAAALPMLAHAADVVKDSRYLRDDRGAVAVSGTGLCVRTGSWTPDTTVAGCDPMPQRVAVAPPPEPAPPAAAAPAEPVAPPPALAETP